MYSNPPLMNITLQEFESYAFERVKGINFRHIQIIVQCISHSGHLQTQSSIVKGRDARELGHDVGALPFLALRKEVTRVEMPYHKS